MKRTLSIALVVLGILGSYFFPLIQPATVREVIHEVTNEVIREVPAPAPATGTALPQAVAVFETSLASPISTSATSMTLTANSVRGGTTLSGYNCLTIDEGSAQAEFVCGTVSGTTVSSLTRGIDPATGTSTVASLQFAHRRGANVKITDFPIITIMRNQLNGVERLENLMVYSTSSQPCAVGSATGTICAKAYIDSVAVAGASNADETTKGIFEAATALEQASSTALGSTGAVLALQAKHATDTPTYGCAVGFTGTAGAGCTVIANLLGKITQSFWNLTEAFTFTATTTHATTTHNGFSTWMGGGISIGTTTATSTGNILIQNNASTTNLTASRAVRFSQGSTFSGFASSTAYEIVTASTAGATTNGTSANTTASCTSGKVAIGGGADISESTSEGVIEASYPQDQDTWYGRAKATGNGAGNTLTVYVICVTL